MKKIYIQPEVQAYEMKVSQVLMQSVAVKGEYEEGNMTDLARSFDFDDEESE